jgi:hypothetical protein
MVTKRKAGSTGAKKHRIRIDIPANGDQGVVKALRAAAKVFSGAEIEEVAGAPSNSYSLTVHVFPDPTKEG